MHSEICFAITGLAHVTAHRSLLTFGMPFYITITSKRWMSFRTLHAQHYEIHGDVHEAYFPTCKWDRLQNTLLVRRLNERDKQGMQTANFGTLTGAAKPIKEQNKAAW